METVQSSSGKMIKFDIEPYGDGEVMEAMKRISSDPRCKAVSLFLWPLRPFWTLGRKMNRVRGTEDLQRDIVRPAVERILKRSSSGFSFDGVEYLKQIGSKCVIISNHRDIVMDPALLQYMLLQSGCETSRICAGDNLVGDGFVKDLMKSNKMITVFRGLKPRELYESSMMLSECIRRSARDGLASVWIAQKEGRAKDGFDETSAAVLKMLAMSGGEGDDFAANLGELNLVPMSISYEYEPCGYLKARELCIKSKDGEYVKGEGEDTASIINGIIQKKGRIHISICPPISGAELESCAQLPKNSRFDALKQIIDLRIVSGYKAFKTNYIAADILKGESRWLGEQYTESDRRAFLRYMRHTLRPARKEERLDRSALEKIFLEIYANPVVRQY